jgi:hypothetical protein
MRVCERLTTPQCKLLCTPSVCVRLPRQHTMHKPPHRAAHATPPCLLHAHLWVEAEHVMEAELRRVEAYAASKLCDDVRVALKRYPLLGHGGRGTIWRDLVGVCGVCCLWRVVSEVGEGVDVQGMYWGDGSEANSASPLTRHTAPST